MKYTMRVFLMISPLVFFLSACKIEPIPDPNNPSLDHLSSNPTLGEIQNLVTGIESGMRTDMAFYWDDCGVLGREFYHFSNSDPRWTSDLVGKGNSVLDNNTFYTTRPYNSNYMTIKNASILISGLTTTTAQMTDQQRKVAIAYANTMKAYELLLALNLQYDSIRVNVADPDHLGPFIPRAQAMDTINALMDQAYVDLSANATTSFPFNSTIFGNTGGQFAQFNRALRARMAVYSSDWQDALTALSNSFLNMSGDMKQGAYYLYSLAGGDMLNPEFRPLNSSGEVLAALDSFAVQATPGDLRLSKVSKRTLPITVDGLTTNYDFYLYKTNVDPIPIIRNEELILIYAEAKIQLGGASNFSDAVNALNTIRNSAGIGNYSGTVDQPSLINEMLRQRRYSLFGEGHRWIDMRRYNRLNELPNERPGDHVWAHFPKPFGE